MGAGLLEPWHLIIILVVVLIIFGAGKLSEVGGALGKGIKDFKEAKDGPGQAVEVKEAKTPLRASAPPVQRPAPPVESSATRPDDI